MAATVSRPPAHPGSEEGNQSSGTSGVGTNCAPQEPVQDPGSSSYHPQHPAVARPVFYFHAPPPPPFLQYQWPMPFSYNPFAGFPAMSYGMVVPPPPLPPPPPPPFMETPAYFLPHPHMQPVDYRRLLHPQAHTQGGSHQNPNQTRRIRPPHTVHVRCTVNSEVQTEPIHSAAGVYDAGSDSGRGTASNSPCTPGSSSHKRASVEVVSYKLPQGDPKDSQDNESCTSSAIRHGFDKCPAAVEPSVRATQDMQMEKDLVGQEPPLPPCRESHMWASSPDSMVPVCSSSHEDGVQKERRISVPDILMGWGSDAPQATLKLSDGELLDEHRLSDEPEAQSSIYQDLTKKPSDDALMLFKILRLPCAFIGSFSDSNRDGDLAESTCKDGLQFSSISSKKFPEHEQEDVTEADGHADMMQAIPCKVSHVRRLNESAWSVESLAPFFPSGDWLLQNGMFDLKINQMNDVGVSTLHGSVACQERSCRHSPSDSVPPSGSWLDFQSPDPQIGGPVQGKSPSEKVSSSSPNPLENYASPPAEEEKGSSEPEAHQSPNQDTNELQEKSSSPEEGVLLLNSAAEETIQPVTPNGVDPEDAEDRGPLTVQTTTEVFLSRGHLVDCGVQCNKIWEDDCFCENLELNGKQPLKYPELQKANMSEAFSTTGNLQRKRNGQWRHRGQERRGDQQENYHGHFKSGKSKGANGRNLRH